MLTPHLSTTARAALAALALATASTGAQAFQTFYPDAFRGQTVDLQFNPPGSRVALPGLGWASSFTINGFGNPTQGSGADSDVFTYPGADFHAVFYASETDSSPAGGVDLLNGIFSVRYVGRDSALDIGTYDLVLETATFTGSYDVTPLVVSLADVANGKVSITGDGPFNVEYITPFSVNGQYALNGGDPIPVPPLEDVNGQPADVPVPATAALAIPGLLAMAGLRRRRAAVAA